MTGVQTCALPISTTKPNEATKAPAAAAPAPTTAPAVAPTAAKPAEPAAKTVPTVISGQTELVVWINDHGPEVQKWFDDELMPAFKKEQPNVKIAVKWENWTGVADRLNQVLAAGSLPDVFTGGAEWVGSMSAKKMALDITPYVKVWGEASDFTEAAMAPFVAPFASFHERTRPKGWLEGLVKAYVGDGIAKDFYREMGA